MSGFLSVKNFHVHQHYKNRRPPWIKFHAALLDDYEFTRLPDASKAHLALIWLLASKLDNRIPNDPEWIAEKIGANAPVDLQGLVAQGFLVVARGGASKLSAERGQGALVETETEAETEAETKTTLVKNGKGFGEYSGAFDELWALYPKRAGGDSKHDAWLQYQARVRAGDEPAVMLDGVKRYAAYCKATGKIGSEYVKQARTFLGRSRHFAETWEVTAVPAPRSKYTVDESPRPRPREYRPDDSKPRDPQRLGDLMGEYKKLLAPDAPKPSREM